MECRGALRLLIGSAMAVRIQGRDQTKQDPTPDGEDGQGCIQRTGTSTAVIMNLPVEP